VDLEFGEATNESSVENANDAIVPALIGRQAQSTRDGTRPEQQAHTDKTTATHHTTQHS